MSDRLRNVRWQLWAWLSDMVVDCGGYGSRLYLRCVRGMANNEDWFKP